jgi:hypothetical protein
MIMIQRQSFFNVLLFSCLCLLVFCTNTNAQRRDHFSEAESDMIREAQEIHLRMAIFVKAIDRRFLVLDKVDVTNDKKVTKDNETWGELRKGTDAQLLKDIEKILDEAINNIDDVAARDLKNKLLPKAMKTLVEGCKRFIPRLNSIAEKTTDRTERETLDNAIEYCNEIIDAQSKIPEAEKKPKT